MGLYSAVRSAVLASFAGQFLLLSLEKRNVVLPAPSGW